MLASELPVYKDTYDLVSMLIIITECVNNNKEGVSFKTYPLC